MAAGFVIFTKMASVGDVSQLTLIMAIENGEGRRAGVDMPSFGELYYGDTSEYSETEREWAEGYRASIPIVGLFYSDPHYESVHFWGGFTLGTGLHSGWVYLVSEMLLGKEVLPLGMYLRGFIQSTPVGSALLSAARMTGLGTLALAAAYGQGTRKSMTKLVELYDAAGIIEIGHGQRSGWSQLKSRRGRNRTTVPAPYVGDVRWVPTPPYPGV